MMGEVFKGLLNISVTAGYIILAALLVRMIFRNMPRKYVCLLWGIAGIRLVLPFSIESALSLIPSRETFTVDPYSDRAVHLNSGVPAVDSAVNEYISNVEIGWVHVPFDNPEPAITSKWNGLAYIWLAGVLIILLYGIISYIRLRKSVSTAVLLDGNVMQCETVKSPFILGIFKPKVYIPFDIDEATRNHVIAHENAHISRFDHITKPLSFLILAVYWFNPLIWLGYILFCRDVEKACDEKVIDSMDGESRKAYATALLQCAVSRRITASPLAFGEVSVKNRIKGVMSYKKPAFWVIIIAVIACIVAAVCFLTSPETPNEKFYDNGQRVKITAETNGFVTEEKYIIAKEGQNATLSNGTKITVTFVNLQTGEINVAFDGTPLQNEKFGKFPGSVTFYNTDKLSYLTEDGKTKITISCVNVGALEDSISEAIIERNKGNYTDGEYVCEAHEILTTEITKKDKNGNIKEVTVYLIQAYCEYNYANGFVEDEGGNGSPIALTFELTDNTFYSLKEYWEPRMGSGYVESIREKFPADCADIAVRSIEPFDECDRMAEEHFNAEMAEMSTTPATTMAHYLQGVTVDVYSFTAVGYSETGREYFKENGIEKYVIIEYDNPYQWDDEVFHIVRIDTKADFDEFMKGAKNHFDFQNGFNGDVPFEKIANRYTERFFEENSLFLGYVVDGSISTEFGFTNMYEVNADEGSGNVHVMHMNVYKKGPEAGDSAMGGWIVSVEAKKSALPETPLAVGFVHS